MPGGEPSWITPAQHACCVRHDGAYYRGGSRDDRLAADETLARCLSRAGLSPLLAAAFFLGVRVGGGPEFRVPGVSWAFGGAVFAYSKF